jgi:serine/threonine-protein kinase
MPLSPGTRLGRYEVVRLLGAGGMGEVYLAKDERLQREVALKVLPAGTLADEGARKRFRNEAMALSKLNHTNIATVHDFGTQGRVDFLVMEYVPGQTLAQHLAGGALLEKEVATLGTQIASALEEAHEHGVVHRDLKPGNVLVTPKGQAKVLDFGLAKLLRPATASATTVTLTETKGAVGTLPYMSPEQLRHEHVDARSDTFAFGAVLYEMATGQMAFREKIPARLTDAILHQPPVTLRAVKPSVSPDLERIVLKCLAKEPDNRYQSAKEVGVDLRRLTTTGVSGPIPVPVPRSKRLVWSVAAALVVVAVGVSAYRFWQPAKPQATPRSGKIMLAVLPLDNLSGDPEQEFFSDGMTIEMITQLGRMAPQQLGVVARTSMMRYKNTEKSVAEIARELHVHYILEGSVRRAGETVRVTVQLIQADDQTQLWAESYDREMSDVLELQSEVARTVAEEIEIKLTPQEMGRLVATRQVDPEAHEAYLRGLYFWNRWDFAEIRKAVEYFETAVKKDPTHVEAYAALALAYSSMALFEPPSEVAPKARATALKALEIDGANAEAYTALGEVKTWYDWDWAGAEQDYKRALKLNPNSVDAHWAYGGHCVALGRFDEGIRIATRALELAPVSLRENSQLAWTYVKVRQFDKAIEQAKKTLELDPEYKHARSQLVWAYAFKGMYEEALAEMRLMGDLQRKSVAGFLYAMDGRRNEALTILEQLLKWIEKEGTVTNYNNIAWVYGALGEHDRAFDYLERAYEEKDAELPLLKVDPFYDPLRDDPRFADLLQRMGFPPT